MTDRATIAIFAKAPIAGLAKTRLAPALGERGAARLQRQLTQRAVATACRAGLGPVQLWGAPDAQHWSFRALALRAGLACYAQCDGDLGRRMAAAFTTHFSALGTAGLDTGFRQAQSERPGGESGLRASSGRPTPMLLIGTDAPSITPAHLRDCAEALHDGNDAVLLPAEDGGYVAIGLSRPATRVFDDIRWSTEHVFEDTRHQLDRAGLRWHQGPTLWDIDVPADLARWHALNHLHNLNNLENA